MDKTIRYVNDIGMDGLCEKLDSLPFEFDVLSIFHAQNRFFCVYKIKPAKRVIKKKQAREIN